MSFDTIIFDLDGTLVHSAPDLTAILNQLLEEKGYVPFEETMVTRLIGDGIAALVERGFSIAGATLQSGELDYLTTRFLDYYRSTPVRLTQPYSGVAETLAALRSKSYRLGVSTNKLTGLARAVLAGVGIDRFFDTIIGSDLVPVKKPDPASLREALRCLGATVGSAIMVGDSEVDVYAARNAGIPVVLMGYGYSRVPPGGLGADAVVDRFGDLPKTIEELSHRICGADEPDKPMAEEAVMCERQALSRGSI